MRDKIVIMEKGAYKTANRPPVKKMKKQEKEKKIEKIGQRENSRFWRKPIMLRWPYILTPPLDHAVFWICCSYHTPLLTDRRDWKEHNLLDRIIIENFLENKKEIHLQCSLVAGRFLSLPPFDHAHSWICGAPRGCLHCGRWRSENHSPARFRTL